MDSPNPRALEGAVAQRDFSQWKVSKTRLELLSVGKSMTRKFLPRRVKTYLRSRFPKAFKFA